MKYTFLNYCLNTENQELYADDTPLNLTKVQYDLLYFLIQHPNKIFSKEEIFQQVWDNKVVTKNSIEQITSKLRKYFNAHDKNAIIKTVYAKGIMFVPEVNIIDDDKTANEATINKQPKYKKALLLSLVIVSIFSLLLWNSLANQPTQRKDEKGALLFVSANQSLDKHNQDWLNLASKSLFDQLYSYENSIELKDIKNKPKHLDTQQFMSNLWQFSPNLKVVNTHITQTKNLYNVSLSITDKLQNKHIQTFSNQNLSTAIKQASHWLSAQIDTEVSPDNFIPNDSYLLELYLHGLSSYALDAFDKAEDYFKLCLKEKADFQLARIQLAKVKRNQGQLNKSLALLETLSKSQPSIPMQIEIQAMRGDIYDTQGKYQQAKDIYLQTIALYQNKYPYRINPIRLNLSHTSTLLNEYQQAIKQLKIIEDTSNDPHLLANVYQKKASILLTIGQVKQATIAAEKSLALFEKQQDLLGKAKIYSNLARISTHQSKYKQSLQYLLKALSISKGIDYKLGTGAILNEMIYLLLVQGKYTQAWQANLDMEKIATEIDYNAMLQISKQYAMDISRAQKKWKQAEIYLAEHQQLAQTSNNKKALIRNKVLALDLYLDEKKLNEIPNLITAIQKHIKQSQELRLQPRLDMQKGRYYFLMNEDQQAIASLERAKKEAQKTEDGETLIEINNILAEYYIKTNQIQQAQAILEESQDYKPLPYPYLLLKSKANEKLGNIQAALDFVNECKLSAYENWQPEDEIYLQKLILKT